jgi:putative DNA-invertase from lambdoid prophage Rac
VKAAIWSRVSTSEQEVQNQLDVLREWAKHRGDDVVCEYVADGQSAWTGAHRGTLNAMLEGARLGKFQVVLVWALDRLSREGIEATLGIMRQFSDRGVRVVSRQESWTDGPPAMQELLTSIFAWMAGQESQRHSERVKAGLARARASGKGRRGPDKKGGDKRPKAKYRARWARERAAKVA